MSAPAFCVMGISDGSHILCHATAGESIGDERMHCIDSGKLPTTERDGLEPTAFRDVIAAYEWITAAYAVHAGDWIYAVLVMPPVILNPEQEARP